MQNKVMITGGAGFIGSNLVRQWFQYEKADVVNVDALTYAGNLASLGDAYGNDRHTFVHADITDAKMMQELLSAHEPWAILNLAAESHVDRSIDGPSAFITTNVVGTFTLLEAVRSYWGRLTEGDKSRFRFLHVSTDEVYGSLGPEGLFTERSPYAPNSPYSASKAASDHLVRAYYETYGIPTLVTNCSNNYGPYQFPEKLIPLMVLNAAEGKPLPVYGDGSNVRDWLFVNDHCEAIRTVLHKGSVGEVYNIGGDSERSNLQVVETICDLVDEMCPRLDTGPRTGLITFVKDRPGHDRRYAIDATKLKQELGWTPTLNFEDGLRKTVRWYLEQQEWVHKIHSGVYRRERLGLTA